MEYLTFEIGVVIISSALVGVLLYSLKQPLILSYILAGILIGPFGFGFINDPEFIHGIATIGVILLLFLIGIEMNVSRLKELGPISLVAGGGQVLFTGLIGFLLVKLFGFTTIQSVYLAIALTFSSTVIAVKIMSDKNDTKSFYGQICIGILIVQDVLAILALLLLTGFQGGSFSFDFIYFIQLFIKGALLTFATLFVSKYGLKYLYNKIATSNELLILFSVSWCFLIALLSMKIGFSIEIGAFIAGISLANLPYTFEINSKARVLRDFFITIFFVALGTGMIFSSVGSLVIPLIVLSLFVLIGNPLIVLILMGLMGYDKRTAFFTGLSIANISEFSLIVIALGSKLGHIEENIVSMTAMIAILTMVLSSYMMTYNNQLYVFLKKILAFFEFRKNKKLSQLKKRICNHVILLGCGQLGEQVLEQILSFKDDYVVVDHDNQVIKKLIEKNIHCIYGDIEDEDLLEEIDFQDAELIISTLPGVEDHYFLMKQIKKLHPQNRPVVIAVANSAREGLEMFNDGVDHVILKPHLGANYIHGLNKEIYQITKELKHVPVSRKLEEKQHYGEHEIARLLFNLNDLRLKEIKEKIKKKKKCFRAKNRDVK